RGRAARVADFVPHPDQGRQVVAQVPASLPHHDIVHQLTVSPATFTPHVGSAMAALVARLRAQPAVLASPSGLLRPGVPRPLLRRKRAGFVFQSFNLLTTLSALENITLPAALSGIKTEREWLDAVVDTVGLGDRLDHRPSELSGGQQQRVAMARALASRPEII